RTALDRNRRHVPLKTRAARREVILVPALAEELQDARNRTDFAAATDYLFPSSVGTPLIWRNVSPRGLAPAAEKAGVGRLRWHDLRHTFASILVATARTSSSSLANSDTAAPTPPWLSTDTCGNSLNKPPAHARPSTASTEAAPHLTAGRNTHRSAQSRGDVRGQPGPLSDLRHVAGRVTPLSA